MERNEHIPHQLDPDFTRLFVWDGKPVQGEGKRYENIVLAPAQDQIATSTETSLQTFEKLKNEEPPLPDESDSGSYYKGEPITD